MTSIIFIGGGGVAVATIVKLQDYSYTGVLVPGPSTLSLSVPDAGDEDETRRIFVLVAGSGISATTGVTILGVSATSHTTTYDNVRIFSALVPTGTSGNVVFSFSGSAARNFTAWVLGTTGIQNGTPIDLSTHMTGTGSASYGLTPDVIEGGVIVGAMLCVTANSVSVTGIDNAEQNFHDSARDWGMWEATDATETPKTVTVTQTGPDAISVAVLLAFR